MIARSFCDLERISGCGCFICLLSGVKSAARNEQQVSPSGVSRKAEGLVVGLAKGAVNEAGSLK